MELIRVGDVGEIIRVPLPSSPETREILDRKIREDDRHRSPFLFHQDAERVRELFVQFLLVDSVGVTMDVDLVSR